MTGDRALCVRRAEAADANAVQEVVRQAYRGYVERMGKPPAPMTADYRRIIRAGHAWVAQHGDQVVALLVLRPDLDHMLIENIAVLPHAQGLGVGTRLLRVAEDQARARGLEQVRLYTNEAMSENLSYYRRRGYHETHRAIQGGFRRVFFVKPIG